LFDEVTRFIAAASGDAPRLILADDVHWADDGTLELLAHVARALGKRAVMLVVSLRAHDLQPSAALARLGRHATHVPLDGLSLDEVEELVTALGTQARDVRWIDALYERTQGNPFFVRQIALLLAQHGEPHSRESLGGSRCPGGARRIASARRRADR
jgi:predicted ATPase